MPPAADPAAKPAAVTPRPAATVVLLRDGPQGIETFMVVRHHEIDFASGALVFPGGKVDTADGDTVWQARAPECGAVPPHAFWVAAVRETFEEAGLLLARRRGQTGLIEPKVAHDLVAKWRPRMSRPDDAATFADMIEAEDLELATDLLVPYAHWITPLGVPKRFDTHFLLVAAPVEQIGLHDGTESVEGLWIRPAQAIADGDAGIRTLVAATRMNLQKLTAHASVAEAVAATRAATVVTVLPAIIRKPEGRYVTIPIEAGYGVSEYFVAAGQPTASGKA